MKKLFLLSFLILPFSSSFAQYMIYGVTGEGFNANNQLQYGTIFKYNPMTHKQTVVFKFNDTDGATLGRLFYASDSLLYGLGSGGSKNMGTLYSYNPKTNVETVLVNFDSTNGYAGGGANELIEGKGGLLYGTMFGGGKYGDGIIFSYSMYSHQDSVRYSFNDSTSNFYGGGSYMELWQDTSTGILYGVTSRGGLPGGGGAVYGFNPTNNELIRYFVGTINSTNPWQFSGGFTQANNGLLYGLSWEGGNSDSGSIYSFDITFHTIHAVYSFSRVNGVFPNTNELLQLSNGLLFGGTRRGGDIGGDGVLFSYNLSNNIEKVLKTFHDTDGSEPFGRLIQDPDNGLLYGITAGGGNSNYGVLYSYDTGKGIYTKLFNFTGPNGVYPIGLTLVKDTSVHVIKDTSGLGVNEVKGKSEKVKIYPNPSKGIFNIEIASQEKQSLSNVEVYNVLGVKVYSNTISQNLNTINLSSQPDGVYLIRVLSADGSLIDQKKVMKVQ